MEHLGALCVLGMGRGSRLPARGARDRCGPRAQLCQLTAATRKRRTVGMPWAASSAGSAGKEPLPEASRTLSRGSAPLGCLERQGLSCIPGWRAASCLLSTGQKESRAQGIPEPSLVLRSCSNTNLHWAGENSHAWLKCPGACREPQHKAVLQLLRSVRLTCLTASLQGWEHSDPGGTEILLRLLRKVQGRGQQDINQPAIQADTFAPNVCLPTLWCKWSSWATRNLVLFLLLHLE